MVIAATHERNAALSPGASYSANPAFVPPEEQPPPVWGGVLAAISGGSARPSVTKDQIQQLFKPDTDCLNARGSQPSVQSAPDSVPGVVAVGLARPGVSIGDAPGMGQPTADQLRVMKTVSSPAAAIELGLAAEQNVRKSLGSSGVRTFSPGVEGQPSPQSPQHGPPAGSPKPRASLDPRQNRPGSNGTGNTFRLN